MTGVQTCALPIFKQIQLSGGINSETDSLFDFLCSEIEGAENITYSIDATYKTPTPSGMSRAIQLGTPFYITIEGEAKLGGFWNLDLVNITVVARGSGVSEHYLTVLFQSAYQVGKAFVIAIIPATAVIALMEYSVHLPSFTWLDSLQTGDLIRQLPILGIGILIYIISNILTYRVASKRFELVDL